MLQTLQRSFKMEPGQTTRDGLFRLEVVACVGACGLAPLISVNGEFHAGVRPDSIRRIINEYRGRAAGNGERT